MHPSAVLVQSGVEIHRKHRTTPDRKRRTIKLIYSVNGISLEHQAALKLKQGTGLPWVAEFRDSWIYNLIEWSEMKNRSSRWWCQHEFKLVKKMLREVVENADLVVVESPMHGALLIRDFKLDSRKVVALGMDMRPITSKIAENPIVFPKRPIIGFVGRVYYGYQNAIKNFVEAMKTLEREGYDFTLVSVGDQENAFNKFASEVKLRSFVPIGRVNYLQALSIMNDLDFGIVATCEGVSPTHKQQTVGVFGPQSFGSRHRSRYRIYGANYKGRGLWERAFL